MINALNLAIFSLLDLEIQPDVSQRESKWDGQRVCSHPDWVNKRQNHPAENPLFLTCIYSIGGFQDPADDPNRDKHPFKN